PDKLGVRGSRALGDRARVAQLVDDGLRAQLAMSSFVTGVRYVALDVFRGSTKDLIADPSVPYPEIPSLPTDLENAEKQVGDVLARLSRVDFEGVVRSAQRALDGVAGLTTSPEIAETLRSIQRGTKSADEAVHNVNAAVVSRRGLRDETAPDVVATGKNVRRASETAVRVGERADALLAAARALVEPAGPAVFRIQESLSEVAA